MTRQWQTMCQSIKTELEKLLIHYENQKKDNYAVVAFPCTGLWTKTRPDLGQSPREFVTRDNIFSLAFTSLFTAGAVPFTFLGYQIFGHTNKARIAPIIRMLNLMDNMKEADFSDINVRVNIQGELKEIKQTITAYPSKSEEYKQLIDLVKQVTQMVINKTQVHNFMGKSNTNTRDDIRSPTRRLDSAIGSHIYAFLATKEDKEQKSFML